MSIWGKLLGGAAGLVMGIAIALAETLAFHHFGRRIAQVHGYVVAWVLSNTLFQGIECGVHRIALGGRGKIADRLRQRQLPFRAAQSLLHIPGVKA